MNVPATVPETGILDALEATLQELERPAAPSPVPEEISMDVPKWAGPIQSRRPEFLAGLCQKASYQGIVERLKDMKVRPSSPSLVSSIAHA